MACNNCPKCGSVRITCVENGIEVQSRLFTVGYGVGDMYLCQSCKHPFISGFSSNYVNFFKEFDEFNQEQYMLEKRSEKIREIRKKAHETLEVTKGMKRLADTNTSHKEKDGRN